ncbi:MAG TPA: hypothetical protein VGS41_00080 [Chthonomonadales bacterium]|nr:hypothetical protein [Chthonomonadales bacterium]
MKLQHTPGPPIVLVGAWLLVTAGMLRTTWRPSLRRFVPVAVIALVILVVAWRFRLTVNNEGFVAGDLVALTACLWPEFAQGAPVVVICRAMAALLTGAVIGGSIEPQRQANWPSYWYTAGIITGALSSGLAALAGLEAWRFVRWSPSLTSGRGAEAPGLGSPRERVPD